MKNIFSQTKDYVKQPKRNVFDLSFHNHGTFNFGYLYPVFCKETLPGDSFKIDPTFALRFLPTAFPVQTRVNAYLHFFYCRNRNLWSNWKKFITHTDDVQFPYLDGSQESIATSGLADYLGVPSTLVGDYATLNYMNYESLMGTRANSSTYSPYGFNNDNPLNRTIFSKGDIIPLLSVPTGDENYQALSTSINLSYGLNSPLPQYFVFHGQGLDQYSINTEIGLLISKRSDSQSIPICYCKFLPSSVTSDSIRYDLPLVEWEFRDNSNSSESFKSFGDLRNRVMSYLNGSSYDVTFVSYDGRTSSFPYGVSVSPLIPSLSEMSYPSPSVGGQSYTDLKDLENNKNPFIVSNNGSVRLSALPFRAYESIYNSFYRNDQNDPLMIDGKPEYDVYVPNTEDGSDSYPYQLYKRNWELDFLTSAVQSPQQGIAPLVGVSQQGDFTFVNKDSDGNIGYFTAKANFSNDGSTITGFQLSDKVELNGLPTNPADASDVPDDVKRGTIYSLNQMALAGISINDFRNVNSLQRWLETNIRRGYKYRDQIKSHYGVDIDEKILDMPEFIGGVSSPVFSSQVNQTVETESDPLGSYAGQLSLITSSNHSIKHYCDEHGFIIGILSIVPVPNYSQLLPKHFLKYNYLDYYFPEFAHIGMQPIDYREVCPIQQYGVDPNGLNDTFGYQRPWYDYIASVDEVHGLFRTNLRNFVLNRQFDSKPLLNADFLQVDPEQLNDIFTVQDVEDKILGQIQFNVIAKRPIPKFGIPRLE